MKHPLPNRTRRRTPGIPLRLEALEDRSLLNAVSLIADRPFTGTEVIVGIRATHPLDELRLTSNAALDEVIDLSTTRVLFGRAGQFTAQVGLRAGADPREAIRQLQTLPSVSWAAPNYLYTREADPREFTPDDPRYGDQYHHPRMQTDLAWDYTLGSTSMVIAVTDDGIDLSHEDLYENIWINPNEIPATRLKNLTDLDGDGLFTFRDLNDPINQGPFKANDTNGDARIDARDLLAAMDMSENEDLGSGGWANSLDDESNFYVDDLVGWDTFANDNNPQPPAGFRHGTHVSGIAAARTNNGVGVAGVAGDALLMPIRFYGNGAWTSAIIAESYTYAASNGARIMTTSYNVDSFADDPTFLAGLNYMYDRGVLHFNSGGNNSRRDSERQRLDHTLYVCNINVDDIKSGTSNWGYGMDLCAPGSNILSTNPNNAYGFSSGTSMASPNAAGVAALLWSAAPDWTREQIVAQLLGTCDDIDELNPAYAGQLGCGRVNAYRAMTEILTPPRFRRVNGLPAEGESTSGQVETFQVDLANVFLPESLLNLPNWEMREAGPDGEFDTDDDLLTKLSLSTTSGMPAMIGTNRLYFTLANALPPGSYRFRASADGLVDPFGQLLDGDGDGEMGGHFDRHFTVLGNGPSPGGDDGGVPFALGLNSRVVFALPFATEPARRGESLPRREEPLDAPQPVTRTEVEQPGHERVRAIRSMSDVKLTWSGD